MGRARVSGHLLATGVDGAVVVVGADVVVSVVVAGTVVVSVAAVVSSGVPEWAVGSTSFGRMYRNASNTIIQTW